MEASTTVANSEHLKIRINDNVVLYIVTNFFLLILLSIGNFNAGIFVIGFLGMIISLICARGLGKEVYCYMTICIVLMTLFLVFHYNMLIERYGIPYYAGDDEYFEKWGHYMYERGYFLYSDLVKVVFTNQGNARGYPLLLSRIEGIVSLFGGYHTVMPRILNLYFWISEAILTLKILRFRVRNPKIEKNMFLGLALFPNGVYISSFVYREAFMEFLMMVIVYSFALIVKEWERFKLKGQHLLYVVIIGISLFHLYYQRVTMIFICVVLGVIIYLDKFNELPKLRRIIPYTLIGVLLAVSVISSDVVGLVNRYTTNYTQYIATFEYGLSSKIFQMPILPYGWLIRVLYGMVCPFPGGVFSIDLFGAPLYSLCEFFIDLGTIFQIFLLPYVFLGVLRKNKFSLMYMAIMFVICLTTFTFRHFMIPLPFLALSSAEMYLSTSGKQHWNCFVLMVLGIVLAACVYIVLR